MKILTLSDVAHDLVYSPTVAERFCDIDLVLSCGDLPFEYLEFVVSMLNKPLFYVFGNHASRQLRFDDGSTQYAPEGCISLHRRVVEYRGLLIGGLEGSMRYKPGDHQYTDLQMGWLTWAMAPKLWRNRLRPVAV